ncbi:hypothetical protein C8Q77DRAFT_295815 [Trametes polyzona]|nr:hypothetical protein C8Q77DRAFT_295815 [Trametes polyzona]
MDPATTLPLGNRYSHWMRRVPRNSLRGVERRKQGSLYLPFRHPPHSSPEVCHWRCDRSDRDALPSFLTGSERLPPSYNPLPLVLHSLCSSIARLLPITSYPIVPVVASVLLTAAIDVPPLLVLHFSVH